MPETPSNTNGLWWVIRWAILIALIYLPTLGTRFDFIDDSCHVYQASQASWSERVQQIAARTLQDFRIQGPFRPIVWSHLLTKAWVFGPNDFAWRAAHWLWTVLCVASLLWFLRELRLNPTASILATAAFVWNPYSIETWLHLTVTECLGMPYALTALACALRAPRGRQPWAWDLLGAVAMLAALACKNTFAAVVPVQVLLRSLPAGVQLGTALRLNAWRAGWLGVTLLLPIVHYVAFQYSWHEGQYKLPGPSLAQVKGMANASLKSVSLEFLGIGVVLAGWALYRARIKASGGRPSPDTGYVPERCKASGDLRPPLPGVDRAKLIAATGLFVLGVVVYLPVGAITPHYVIPAAWGAVVGLALFFGALLDLPANVWKRGAIAALILGLVVCVLLNVRKQWMYHSRIDMLWDTLECVESQAPPNGCIAWCWGRHLGPGEAYHFIYHLQARGRSDLTLMILDAKGKPPILIGGTNAVPDLFIDEIGAPEPSRCFLGAFHAFYGLGGTGYHCYLYRRTPPDLEPAHHAPEEPAIGI